MLRYCLLGCLLSLGATTPIGADEPAPKAKQEYQIPYRLTDTKHILVRAKLNGQGPFNFILDTGAPAVFIPKKVAEKVGIKLDSEGWGTFDKFQLEGGLTNAKTKTRVEDLFQLEGMNGMGLAGVELHGVIGYNVLAQYRITYDFTKPKLRWVHLDFTPPSIQRIGGGGGGQGGLEVLGSMMKVLAGFMGMKPNFEVQPVGFLGFTYEQKPKGLFVTQIFPKSPAADAGIAIGDRITDIGNRSVDDERDLKRLMIKVTPGQKIKISIDRDGEAKTLTITAGKGL